MNGHNEFQDNKLLKLYFSQMKSGKLYIKINFFK